MSPGAADKNPATAHRSAFPAGGDADDVRADYDVVNSLHVPERERAVQNINAVTMWALGFGPRIGRHDVEAIHLDMPRAQHVTD